MQLAALHDVVHNRISLDTPDRNANTICPICLRNEERKKEYCKNLPEPWDDEAIPAPPPNLETCPIDAISEMLYHMLPTESKRIHTHNDDLPILNAYLTDIRHPWYKPDQLDQQLCRVCEYRKEHQLCEACWDCPVTTTRVLMHMAKNDTSSKPENGWVNTKPWSYKWGIKCTSGTTTFEFDAHIPIPKGRSIYSSYDAAEEWTRTFINPDAGVTFGSPFNNHTQSNCLLMDCIGTNRKHFLLELPDPGYPNIQLYANNFLKTYLQNIKFYKLRRPPNQ